MPNGCWEVHAALRRHISCTELDSKTGAVFARSVLGGEFGGRVAFADLGGKQASVTGDRTEFLGRNGTLERPAALERGSPLSGKVGAGLDPCAALQTLIELRPGASAEIVFFLGQAENREQARELLGRYRTANLNAILSEVTGQWDNLLNTVQITTPEPAMDILMNRWLLYQTLASRVWARAAFYQLSGAYGFRDQLQDGMALCVAKPRGRARASAARRLAAIYRRRCSTLVASAIGARRANAHLRRSPLAALCRHPLH